MDNKFEYIHNVQYYETDQMKVVHHSNYIRWFEEARVAWLKANNLSCQQLEERGIVIPVVDISCKYHKMSYFEDEIIIEPRVTKFNGVVVEFEYKVYERKTGEVRVTGTSSHCFINENYKVMNLKKNAEDVYDKLLEIIKEQNE